MKILGFILLFLFGIFYSTPFKIMETTQQNVVGGRMESGRSEVFEIKLIAKKPSSKLVFEDLWIGVKHFKIKATHQKADNSISTDFAKGDTILIQAIERYLPSESGELVLQKSDNIKSVPMEYTGKALIGFKFKNKQRYFVIDDFKQLKTEERP